ncbi:MAG: FkbM family methyltransferase [Desulfamplus sp.]|nr:FkbM family methyltransferase [Desulfamplus sp.]
MMIEDIPVALPENFKLSDKEKSEAFVFNAVNDGDDPKIYNYLKSLGYKKISSISEWWFFNCWVTKKELFEIQKKEYLIMDALKLWNDEKSVETYINNIKCYLTREYVHGTRVDTEEQYFPKDFKLEKGYGCFVDCGAFTGDTILRVNKNIGTVDTLVAFEPDSINFAKLKKNMSTSKKQIAENLLLYPCGVWSKTEKLRFFDRGESGSIISDEGDSIIQCISIDDALCKISPTLIKMDVEGSEYNRHYTDFKNLEL